MKAIVIRAYGGAEVMKLDDAELPAPGAGEALRNRGRSKNFLTVSWLPITSRARLGHCCRYERVLRIPITGDIVVERRGQISLQLRVGASCLGMVAQIVTKQKTVLPSGVVSLQNMEVVCPWPGKSRPVGKLARQPSLVLWHVGITQRLKRPDAALSGFCEAADA